MAAQQINGFQSHCQILNLKFVPRIISSRKGKMSTERHASSSTSASPEENAMYVFKLCNSLTRFSPDFDHCFILLNNSSKLVNS